MLTEQQFESRKGGLGGSDAAAILGLSPWKTPLNVYLEKTGKAPKQQETPAMYWGTVLEDVVANEYAKRTGYKIQRRNQLLRHKQHPMMCGLLDRVVVGSEHGPGIVECKTARARDEDWGDEGTDEVPQQYLLQIFHYMAVTGYTWAELPVLFLANRDFRIYRFERDEELIDYLVNTEKAWWRDHIELGVAPEGDWSHPAASKLLTQLYPGTTGEIIELPEQAAHWHQVARESAELEKQYKTAKEGAHCHLRALMGEASIALLPDGTGYTRKEVKRKGYAVEPSSYINFSFSKSPKGVEK